MANKNVSFFRNVGTTLFDTGLNIFFLPSKMVEVATNKPVAGFVSLGLGIITAPVSIPIIMAGSVMEAVGNQLNGGSPF